MLAKEEHQVEVFMNLLPSGVNQPLLGHGQQGSMRKRCKKTRKYIETVCMGVIEPGGKQRVKYCVSETAVE